LYKAAKDARAVAERDVKRLREQIEEREKKTKPCAVNWYSCARIVRRFAAG